MSCQTVRNSLSGFLDQRMGREERTRVAEHLSRCRECATHLDKLTQLRQGLLQLPAVAVPNRLQTQLQILVSRERARWDSMRTLPLALHTWADNIKLAVDNLMRPLALPLTGGLLSALLLFSVLVPTLGFHPVGGKDVPIRLYTAATLVEATPFDLSNDEAVVELYVDAKGQAMDYSIERGKVSPEMQADLNRLIFFSRCTPATWFGRPTSGTVLVSFRRIHYVVRG